MMEQKNRGEGGWCREGVNEKKNNGVIWMDKRRMRRRVGIVRG